MTGPGHCPSRSASQPDAKLSTYRDPLSERLSEAVALQQVHNGDMSQCADAEIMLVSERGCRSLKEPKPF
jgi:hypothetical protein